MFSGLNNLNDISLSPRFAAICGYTDADIDAVFAPELDGLDREKIRTWYNGYGWCGETRVYNPNDLLLFLRNHEFRCYWRDTGTPSFLFGLLFGKMMKQSFSLMELEGRMVNSSMLSMFEVDSISIEALLFQTGYLTITEEVRKDYRTFYRLDYPNLEEQLSLNNELLAYLDERNRVPFDDVRVLRSYLEVHDFEGFSGQFRA
ncbi:MAG: AAA family ATPase [Rhodobacteraceae bacterium]|nr:AAA family ATPase [Paracoccaceae bacterium]